jgi:hypothetical protein
VPANRETQSQTRLRLQHTSEKGCWLYYKAGTHRWQHQRGCCAPLRGCGGSAWVYHQPGPHCYAPQPCRVSGELVQLLGHAESRRCLPPQLGFLEPFARPVPNRCRINGGGSLATASAAASPQQTRGLQTARRRWRQQIVPGAKNGKRSCHHGPRGGTLAAVTVLVAASPSRRLLQASAGSPRQVAVTSR